MKWNIRQVIALLLAGACLLALILPVLATETTVPEETQEVLREPGQCGESMYWSLSGSTLTITGTGVMDDFPEGAPWADSRETVTKVVIGGGITYIGASAFENFDRLTAVEFGGDVREIGKAAFRSCDALREVTMPASFRVFGEDSFRSCALMYKFHFKGGMPSFRLNCLWDTTAKLIYPANNPWPLEHIQQLEEAFQGRIEFLASDGTDPYITEQDLEEATAPTTETTEPYVTETTVPETTAATQPETTAVTTMPAETAQTLPAETAATTRPVDTTGAPQTTAAATEPQLPAEPENPNDSGVGFALILAVLSLLALGALVFGKNRSRGGKYRG